MAFFKFRSRGQPTNESRNTPVSAAPAESVEAMRRRARHRLLGAAVLVLVGVIGFPLLFDTQPRPVAVDIPIEIPDRNKVAPLPAPVAQAPASTPAAPPAEERPRAAANAPATGVITETADGRELPSDRPVASAPPAETHPAPKPEPKPKPEAKPEPKPEPKPQTATAAKPADDGARARALLDGKNAAAATAAAKPVAASDDAGRFVVQVGAFAEADKAREVRQKLERAGLKTYTNIAKTADGDRTRVRVGPFASRAEADKAAAKVKGLSLPAAVLSL
ncbi:SPOR domain-containing protein [Variovorax sp. N23]|uniref:SPOR domain-containing protein n=1 Tax=Variovorax sp. N23 TaxID=2980555 RepID=UPI0021C65EFB|nr:SPOR domain-containing protein [Variovorax sp. N23]MCU4121548.1 SPOR domain-containing protein [Variovorax sp. N23]